MGHLARMQAFPYQYSKSPFHHSRFRLPLDTSSLVVSLEERRALAYKKRTSNSIKRVGCVQPELTKHGLIVVPFQSDALLSRLDQEMLHKFIIQINFLNFVCKRKQDEEVNHDCLWNLVALSFPVLPWELEVINKEAH